MVYYNVCDDSLNIKYRYSSYFSAYDANKSPAINPSFFYDYYEMSNSKNNSEYCGSLNTYYMPSGYNLYSDSNSGLRSIDPIFNYKGVNALKVYNTDFGTNTSHKNSCSYAKYQFTIEKDRAYGGVKYGLYSPKEYNVKSLSSSISTGALVAGAFGKSRYSIALDCNYTLHKPLKYSYSPIKSDVKAKLGPEFLAKVKEVAKNINCNYKDLLAVMNAESGLDPTKKNNAGHEMYGLIQFSADSAKALKTTHAKLIAMSAIEQLDYVEKYYKSWIKEKGWEGKRLSAADLYALVLAPGRAGKDVLYTKVTNKKQYTANKGIDIHFGNGDGKIDKNDCEAFIASKQVNESIFA